MRIKELTAHSKLTEYVLIGRYHNFNKIDVFETLMLNNLEIKRAKKTKSFGVIKDIKDNGLIWKQH